MSDIAPVQSSLEWKLSIDSPSLAYTAKAVTRETLCALKIPYPLLKAWHKFLTKKSNRNVKPSASQGPSTSAINLEEAEPYSYADLLEFSIPGNCFCISDDPSIRYEIHSHLQELFIVSIARPRGRKENPWINSPKNSYLWRANSVSIRTEKGNDLMKDELEEWKAKYNNLDLELKNLREGIVKELKEKDKTIDNLQSINHDLLDYVDILEKNENVSHKGERHFRSEKEVKDTKNIFIKSSKCLMVCQVIWP